MFLKSSIICVLLFIAAFCNAEDINNTEEDHENEESSTETLSEVDSLPNFVSLNNMTEKLAQNVSLQNATEGTNATRKFVACNPGMGSPQVQLVNDTELIKLLLPDGNITSKDTPANCIVVLFYSKFCPFSSMAAPHFNALARAFPDIKMVAINAMMYHLFNTQNGIVGVPSLLLFHNGRSVAKFNDSEYTLELFSNFINKHTGINAQPKSYVTSADFSGPVSSVPSKDSDIYLGLSWAFIILCSIYFFMRSKLCKWIVENVQRIWREAEAQAQHEHDE